MPKLHDGVDQRTIPAHLATITTTVTRMWGRKPSQEMSKDVKFHYSNSPGKLHHFTVC